jgi:hypothetical protein
VGCGRVNTSSEFLQLANIRFFGEVSFLLEQFFSMLETGMKACANHVSLVVAIVTLGIAPMPTFPVRMRFEGFSFRHGLFLRISEPIRLASIATPKNAKVM